MERLLRTNPLSYVSHKGTYLAPSIGKYARAHKFRAWVAPPIGYNQETNKTNQQSSINFLLKLLEREPTKRMGMSTCKAGDIYDQPWFKGVDWPATEEMRVQPPFVPEVVSEDTY